MLGEIIHGHSGRASVLGLGRPLLPTGDSCRRPPPSLVQGLSLRPRPWLWGGRWSICIEVWGPRGRPQAEMSGQAWVFSHMFWAALVQCTLMGLLFHFILLCLRLFYSCKRGHLPPH